MSETSAEKRFEPTPSRLQKAKREGNTAKSQDLCSIAAFGGALIATVFAISPLAQLFRAAITAGAENRSANSIYFQMSAWMLVPLVSASAAAICAGIAQTGGLHVVAVTPKPERLHPVEGLKRMLSRDAALTALRATLAFTAAAIAIAPVIVSVFDAAIRTGAVAPMAVAAWRGAWNVALAATLVGAAFGVLDYGVQLAGWRKKLRMTFEELKRDAKENDGDPHARGRRRALHRELSRGSLQRVKDAAFVVTNPTHIAIALEYRPPDVAVPRVLVRAVDEGATRVRELARSHGIPLIENVPLARSLYAAAEAGAYIPHEHYVAVAEIVAALVKAGVLK